MSADDEFEAQKRGSFVQVLFKAGRLANEAALARARERSGQAWLRTAHTNLFPHISFEGVRLTEIAERVGVTKQAVQVLVDDLVAAGMVERIADPADGRAKLIRWTEHGRRGLIDGVGLLMEFEAELAGVLGAADVAQAHATLLSLVAYLEQTDGER